MTLHIIPRASWGARSPRAIQTVGWDKRTGFVVHHSDGPETQSVRAIQNFHMDSRGWSDIGYNFLVDYRGNVYEGRGWNRVGAHVKGYNTATIGVCVIGTYTNKLPAAPALISLIQLYGEAERLKGAKLGLFGHRELGSTECPGDRLYSWVHADMRLPVPAPVPVSMDHRPGTRELVYATGAPIMEGPDVSFVQRFIGPAWCGPSDGRYGPNTADGVRRYQRMEGLGIDGRVGPSTWGRLGVRWTG